MTPEQFDVLVQTYSTVKGMDERFEAIDVRCAECHEEMRNTRIVLNGRPGRREGGLKTRVGLVEQSYEDVKESQRSQIKWFRIQLGAIITAVVAIATKWFMKG